MVQKIPIKLSEIKLTPSKVYTFCPKIPLRLTVLFVGGKDRFFHTNCRSSCKTKSYNSSGLFPRFAVVTGMAVY